MPSTTVSSVYNLEVISSPLSENRVYGRDLHAYPGRDLLKRQICFWIIIVALMTQPDNISLGVVLDGVIKRCDCRFE